jgi:hypothetical protein
MLLQLGFKGLSRFNTVRKIALLPSNCNGLMTNEFILNEHQWYTTTADQFIS